MVAETTYVSAAGGGGGGPGGRPAWASLAYNSGRTNQELCLAKGVTKISWIADRLQLSTQIQEAGRRMYQLALQMNFGAGRPTRLVASACLYVVCRRNRSPHLLIDFSDVLQSPVKVLGGCYMRLLRRLVGGDPSCPLEIADSAAIEVPIVDPSIFIERFARKLNLGGAQRKVQNTAMRLIQFMHRDWICLGRRPNGLCGAALLIAAYYHGFKCSAQEIAEIVRIGEGTLRTRLKEMRETPLSLMSREEFEKADINALDDANRTLPPCMKRQKLQDRIAALLDQPKLALGFGQIDAGEGSMLPPAGPPVWRRSAEAAAATPNGGSSSSSSSNPNIIPESSRAESLEDLKKAERFTCKEPSENEIHDIARDIASHHGIEAILSGEADPIDPAVVAAAAKIREMESGELPPAGKPEPDPEPQEPEPAPVDTLSDVDDEELDMYLLDQDEQQHKSDIWHEVNKDYLEEWHIRSEEMRRKRAEKAQGSNPATPLSASCSEAGSRRRPSSRHQSASSCTQSAMLALAKRKVRANRINVEALESLFS